MSEANAVRSLCADQCHRWQQGDFVRVEAYLEQHPDLSAKPEAVLDLICNELFLREQVGKTPELGEYLQRFPQFETALRAQFDVHQAIQREGRTSVMSVAIGRVTPPSPAAAPVPTQATVDGYEIIELLGRGGMGVVYRARQVALKRDVALKMILAGHYTSAVHRARFATEAEAVARLQHPNIVQIYEVGEREGLPYLSLELVEGGSLEEAIRGQPQLPALAGQLLEILARAAHYAHQHGIIHRDLKPSNILLSFSGRPPGDVDSASFPERLLDEAVPKISDFGLAKLQGSDHGPAAADGLTVSGAILGTPNYMAPEQAMGRTGQLGPWTDVYGLGAILYELLTGEPPFRGETELVTLLQVQTQEPVPPSYRRPAVPHDLETICLKCLEKEPQRRYASARDLAEDLRHFLAGEPIQARPVAVWERGLKWIKRRPALTALVGLSAAGVVSLPLLIPWYHAEVQATAAQARADERQTNVRAREQYEKFLRYRDDAQFYGITLTLDPGTTDLAHVRGRAETAARAALAIIEATDSPESAVLRQHFGQTELAVEGYHLRLMLAEALAQPLLQQTADEHGKRLREALQILDAAPRTAPTPEYHLRRARYFAQLGDESAARRERLTAAALKPVGWLDYFLRGDERHRDGNIGAATCDFQRALQLRPDHFWSRALLAICHLKLEKCAEAKVLLTVCLDQQPDFLWGYLLRGFAYTRLGAYADAEADFQRALELQPDDGAAYFLRVNRGILRFHQDRLPEAAAELEQAIASKPDQYGAHVSLAKVYRQEKKLGQAIQQLDQALSLRPPDRVLVDCLAEKGRDLYLGGSYELAVGTCEAALKRDSNHAEAYAIRALALVRLKHYREGLRAFEEYLQNGWEPTADVYLGRGLCRVQMKNYPGAVDDYTQALKLRNEAEIRLHRGWAYFFSEAWKLAIRDFDSVIRLQPEDADAYVGRGLAQVMLGQHGQAVADAEDALRRQPASPEMMHNIACIFAQALARVQNDPALPDRVALSARCRVSALEAVRKTVGLVPASERARFWREMIVPDAALDSIRHTAEFKRLQAEFGRPQQ